MLENYFPYFIKKKHPVVKIVKKKKFNSKVGICPKRATLHVYQISLKEKSVVVSGIKSHCCNFINA